MTNVAKSINGVKPAPSGSTEQQFRRYCLGLAFIKNEEDRKRFSAYLEGMGAYYGFGFEESKQISSEVAGELEEVKTLVDWVLSQKPAK